MKPFYISLKPFLDHCVLARPVDWRQEFTNDRPLEVEIGFGNGEYLARLCAEHPDVNYVGFEEYCERISRTLRKLSRTPSENVRVMRFTISPFPITTDEKYRGPVRSNTDTTVSTARVSTIATG